MCNYDFFSVFDGLFSALFLWYNIQTSKNVIKNPDYRFEYIRDIIELQNN